MESTSDSRNSLVAITSEVFVVYFIIAVKHIGLVETSQVNCVDIRDVPMTLSTSKV